MRRTSKPRALFICGSLNQTTQLHRIATELTEFTAAFTPFYGTARMDLARRLHLLDHTILGDKLRQRCLDYLRIHDLAVDVGGCRGPYDLVVGCTDVGLPDNLGGAPLLIVQEGMVDPANRLTALVRHTRLPLYLAGTALTATSGRYDRFCAASAGYRELLVLRGAPRCKIVVTGIPNFDDCASYARNDLPDRQYVLACTSDLRETYRRDDRPAFIERVRRAAQGRPVHFKLHPAERVDRAQREIARFCPGAHVHTSGSAEHLVANCASLFTQYSSLAFVGIALGKEVHSYFDLNELHALLPIQNGGTSALRIADVARELVGLPRRHGARLPRAVA